MAATAWADGRLPMVGRDAELRLLLAAADRAAAGQPSAVVVAGDAGVGKSRLLRTFRDRLPAGFTVVEGHCIDLGDVGLPYLPFSEALADLPPEAVAGRALGPLLPGAPEGAPGDAGRLQLYEAVAGSLHAAGPVALVIEDLHWADAASRDLLRFLLARMRDEQLLLVATYRADDLHRRHPLRPLLAELARLSVVERVELAPLKPRQLRAHLAQAGPLPESLLGPVLERSEGNPYFAEELVTAALEAGYVDGRVLPARLADVVLARLERLSPDAVAVIRVAAVAGRRVDAALLEMVCDAAGVPSEAGLREAVEAQVLVTSGDRVAFRHALLQETVYDDLLPVERVRLHAVFAEVLDRPGVPALAAERAHHAEQSGDQQAAYQHWLRAGDDAAGAHAPREALRSYERALGLTAQLRRRVEVPAADDVDLLLRAGSAAVEAGELQRAADHSAQAVTVAERAGLTEWEGIAHRLLATQLIYLDREPEARVEATRARDLLAGSDGLMQAKAAATWARTLVDVETGPVVEAAVAEALALLAEVDDTGPERDEIEVDALTTLALSDELGGRPDDAVRSLRRTHALAVSAGDLVTELRVAYNIAANRFYAGDLEVALADADAAVRRAAQVGLTWGPYGADALSLQVVIRYVLGRWDEATTLAMLPTSPLPTAVGERLSALALYVEVARGGPVLDRAVELAATIRDAQGGMIATGCAADALTWAGRPVEAIAVVEAGSRRLVEQWGDASLGGIWLNALGISAYADFAAEARLRRDSDTVDGAVEAGRALLASTHDVVRRGRPRGGGSLGPEGRAWLARATAELSRLEDQPSPELWEASVEAFAFGHVYEQARSRWRLAESLAGSDPARAAAELRAVLEVASALGAEPLRAGVLAVAARRRLDVGVVRAAPTGGLTARELQVLRLVAEGLTNRQVGATLYISEKTASVHVSNVIAKLGASGRTEAAAIATRRGLLEP